MSRYTARKDPVTKGEQHNPKVRFKAVLRPNVEKGRDPERVRKWDMPSAKVQTPDKQRDENGHIYDASLLKRVRKAQEEVRRYLFDAFFDEE